MMRRNLLALLTIGLMWVPGTVAEASEGPPPDAQENNEASLPEDPPEDSAGKECDARDVECQLARSLCGPFSARSTESWHFRASTNYIGLWISQGPRGEDGTYYMGAGVSVEGRCPG